MSTILVVDDKEMMRDSVAGTLRRAGFDVQVADNAQAALEQVRQARPDAVVSDLKMPGMTGIDLLEQIRKIDEDLPVVLMTAFGSIETAVDAMRHGAFDYLTKPFEGDELIITIKRALNHGRIVRENALLKSAATSTSRSGVRTGLGRIIGSSPAMRRVKAQIEAVADSQGTVLITGESGSGKEVVAQAVHDLSSRAGRPFLAVNCAALSESLLESELFGHERGAFTGADRLRKGRFELADGGTLLLDEVSEISPQIQAKLLRVLQERAFERVGSSMTIGVDVRVIATSNRDLPRAAARGDFRQDLFFRLNVLPIHLPPLRDRLEDVPALAEHFIREICTREGINPVELEPEAIKLLTSYQWPGNVRELQNICERAVVLCGVRRSSGAKSKTISRDLIEPWLIPARVLARPAPSASAVEVTSNGAENVSESKLVIGPGRTLADIEREAIVQALQRHNGHRQKTADALGIGVRTLGLKLKKWKEENLVAQSL
ncbi:MAG: sigma-54-dependent Fis family transcriptional regulator [Planctomycetota bacterium]|nr:MAG: sigma-54-dependent Fis family transcriptional regulator [Planctomycetota bacterium]